MSDETLVYTVRNRYVVKISGTPATIFTAEVHCGQRVCALFACETRDKALADAVAWLGELGDIRMEDDGTISADEAVLQKMDEDHARARESHSQIVDEDAESWRYAGDEAET